MKRHRGLFLAHFTGFSLLVVPITSVLAWAPTYLSRVLGFGRADSGFALGLMLLILSPAAVFFGGWLVDLLQKRGYPDAAFRVSIGAALALIPLGLFATTGRDPALALWLIGPLISAAYLVGCADRDSGDGANEMRAQISAVWMLCMNLFKIMGPTLVGFITVYVLADAWLRPVDRDRQYTQRAAGSPHPVGRAEALQAQPGLTESPRVAQSSSIIWRVVFTGRPAAAWKSECTLKAPLRTH
jgi:hypothetical protein